MVRKAIVAIMAGMIFAQVVSAGQPAKKKKADKPLTAIEKAISEHRLINGMTIQDAANALGVNLHKTEDGSLGATWVGFVPDPGSPQIILPSTIQRWTDYAITISDGVISYWKATRMFSVGGGQPQYEK